MSDMTSAARSEGEGVDREKQRTQREMMWRKFKRNKLGQLGLMIVALFIAITLFAPFFSPYDFKKQRLRTTNIPPQSLHFFDREGNFHLRPFVYKLKKTMDPETYELIYTEDRSKRYPVQFFVHSWEYELFGLKSDLHLFGIGGDGYWFVFGTGSQGRDLFSRILEGGRVSLTVAILGAISTVLIGSIVGSISGYYGGVMDLILQRIVELLQCFPKLPLWMTLSVVIPTRWPPAYILYGIVGIFSLVSWPFLARQVRGKVLSYREEDYVMSAKSIGASDRRIIFRHVLPQALSHIITAFTIQIPVFILAESMLSFLGLGIQPPMISWGVLLKRAQNLDALGQYPWLLIPGLFIMLAVLGFNFFGDGLRDAADPFSQ